MLQVDNNLNMSGILSKMQVNLNQENLVEYYLVLDNTPRVLLNNFLGKNVCLEFSSLIKCIYCNKRTKSSYSQGYCYICAKTLARCDLCIVRPKNCHYHLGSCREPKWGQEHCFTSHIVYLANSSGIKVGISRATNIPNRWIDQGAIQALPIISTASRYQAGLIEDILAKGVADKTNWRKMLNFNIDLIDLIAIKDDLLHKFNKELADIKFDLVNTNNVININYPISFIEHKISLNTLNKLHIIEGTLLAIKGQYLIFEHGVINIRNFSGYEINFRAS